MRERAFNRFFAALPDSLTAGYFLTLWIAPLRFGVHGVRNGMLMMLVEFILIHASAFIGAVAFADEVPRASRIRLMAGFALFYLFFVSAWSWAFHEYWPFLAFGWLLIGKLLIVFGKHGTSIAIEHEVRSNWAISALAFIGGAALSVVLPIPRLGLDAALLPGLGLPASGVWAEQPQTVVAFGVFYFGMLAWTKWRGTLLPADSLPGLKARLARDAKERAR